MLLKLIPSRFVTLSSLVVSIIFILALSNVFAIPKMPTYQKVSNPGMMDKPHWEAFKWISTNTDKGSKIYFFYGDVYGQDAILRNSERLHAQVIPDDFISSLQNRTVKKIYQTE